jgi:hypothetical protein
VINCEEADKAASSRLSGLSEKRVIRFMHGTLEISAYLRLRLQESYMAEMN